MFEGILEYEFEELSDSATKQIAVGLVCLIDMRDSYTAHHLKGTADIAVALGKKLGLLDRELEEIYAGALLHDIGKIAIPSQLLSKPGFLLPAEFELIKTHSEHSWKAIEGLGFSKTVTDIAHYHHEKLDGSGYPEGLKGDEIGCALRIVTVADCIHAMASKRTYRLPASKRKILEELDKSSGIKLDQDVVQAAKRIVSEGLGKVTKHI